MPEPNSTSLEPPSDYGHDHRRASCDELIAQSYTEDLQDGGELSDNEPLDNQNLLGRQSILFTDVDSVGDFQGDRSSRTSIHRHSGISEAAIKRRAFFVRSLALLCACFLSVGSH